MIANDHSPCAGYGSGAADAALLDLVEQRLVAHAQNLRRLAPVPVHLPQASVRSRHARPSSTRPWPPQRAIHCPSSIGSGLFVLSSVVELRRCEGSRHGAHTRRNRHARRRQPSAPARPLRPAWRRGAGCSADLADDELLVLEDDHALDHVLQLADVARPVVLEKQLPQLIRDRPQRAVVLPGISRDEKVGERRDLVAAARAATARSAR